MMGLRARTGVFMVLWCAGCDPTDKDGAGDTDDTVLDTDAAGPTGDTDVCLPEALDCMTATAHGVRLYLRPEHWTEEVADALEPLPGWTCDTTTCALEVVFEPVIQIAVAPLCLTGALGPGVFDPGDPAHVCAVCEPEAQRGLQPPWIAALTAIPPTVHLPGDPSQPIDVPALKWAAQSAVLAEEGVLVDILHGMLGGWDGQHQIVAAPACDCDEGFGATLPDHVFRVDPTLSSVSVLEPGGSMVSSTLSGYLFGANQPARFLFGRVTGEDVPYGGQLLKETAAGFDVPMTIDAAGGTVTVTPTNQDDIWWRAVEEATGEAVAFAVAPSAPVTGTVDLANGTWSLGYTQTLGGADTITVTLGGQVWQP